ncbi:MAG: putative lipid II flippase FtsW [Deltaproteobacteria bacterium]|nr:putative lipid II flippase FtsW [Deltaproteobacteria bacterium]
MADLLSAPLGSATFGREDSAPELRVLLRPRGHDLVLFTAVAGLVSLGIVMVYSASAVFARQKYLDAGYFLRRDLCYAAVGFLAMYLGARVDYSVYRRLCYPLLGGAAALLVLVLFVGARINGATRWLHLGPALFQPVELAKFALWVYLAYSLAKKTEQIKSFTIGFLPHFVVCGLMAALVLKQPDLGTAVVLLATTIVVLFVAGAKIGYIIIAALVMLPIGWKIIVGTPWRLRRILAFLDPWQFRRDVGYQISESLISIGSGGVTGVGLGDGKQKLFFLPEAHTDFLAAIVGEELGLLGLGAVMAIFGVVVWRGLRTAWLARDSFGRYLAFALTIQFSLQALIHLGVVMGLLPTKGLTLPFVSYGGTSLVISMFAAGVLLNISTGEPPPEPTRLPTRRRLFNRRVPGANRTVIFEVPGKSRTRPARRAPVAREADMAADRG